jgi:hypothetical protein
MPNKSHDFVVVVVICEGTWGYLSSKGNTIVEDQLNCKEVNDKATKSLVNFAKRVEID